MILNPAPSRAVHPTNEFAHFDSAEVEQSVGSRFEQQAEIHSNRVAVKTQRLELSYGNLNRTANLAAHAILDRIGEGEQRVALLLEHDAPLIALMLGVLKAGKVAMPLDPSYPKSRSSHMLADSEPALVITNRRNLTLARCLVEDKSRLLDFDEIQSGLAAGNPGLQISPRAYAAIIYTSASTGPPKGVIRSHRGVLHNTMGYTNGLHICSEDRLPLLASCSSGQGISTVFCALLNGAALLPFDIKAEGIDGLAGWLAEQEVSIYSSAATVYRHLLSTVRSKQQLAALRLVRLGSEQVHKRDIELYKEYFAPECILVNALSGTETGNFSQFFIDKETEIGHVVPVGYAVEGKQVLILDEKGNELGWDRIGEIAVRSEYLSPGYWRRPDLTMEAFLAPPEGGSERIFRTGDLGRMRPDGCLEWLGRKDFRVKIRGYRIELEEIETTLCSHPGLRGGAVIVRDAMGEKRLAAFYVPVGTTSARELRQYLRERLPEHMVPSELCPIDALPMTPNRKVDRSALAGMVKTEARPGYVAPRTSVEAELAAIWREVLHSTEPIGVEDSFFDIGGHSLNATQVASRVRERLAVAIALREFLENPTIARLAERIELHRGSEAVSVRRPLCPLPRNDDPPLSFAQQRHWFLHQLNPDSSAWSRARAFRLLGPLSVTAMERALNEIVRRHEILRTTFPAPGGHPVQKISAFQPFRIKVVDLGNLDAQKREREAQRLMEEEARRPYDLQAGPFLRPMLVRLGEQEHALMIAMHHIVFDRWSRSILCRELSALYEAFAVGKPASLPELSIQYADFAQWQRQELCGEVFDRQLAYWCRRLDGSLPALDLPADRPRPAVQSYRGLTQTASLPLGLRQALETLGRKEGATLFMTLLAAFQVLLYRVTGQDDILVGSPIANRLQTEVERMIGSFVNTLVLRTDLSGDPGFRELLKRVKEVTLEAYSHQQLPFDRLVEALNPARDPSRGSLFQVMFAFQNTPALEFEIVGLDTKPMEVETGASIFDLFLAVIEEPNGLLLSAEYSTDLFDSDTITRLLGHFRTLLEGIVANPDQRISDLPLLTAAEQHRILVEWNDTQTDYPRDACIHHLFEAQVERAPDGVAVVFEGKELTYRELNTRANQLAHYLKKVRVGPEVLVGVCMERSIAMLVGLLGVLKAGGAYIPLDPAYPRERLEFMLQDAEAAHLLTQNRLLPLLQDVKAQRICVDGDWPRIAQEATVPVEHAALSRNLAYVIYTSGATGKPKGVEVEHRNAVSFLNWCRQVFPEESAGVLASTSICFDLSILELFLPLISGGRIILTQDILDLQNIPQPCGVTLINTVPSVMEELVGTKIPGSVRTVNLAGEPLKQQLVDRIYLNSHVRSVYDLYGPTEATTYATFALRTPGGAQTIGRPIANTRVYILDDALRPLPIGVQGQIHIAGDCVARGYLKRPELTEERFIPDPFSPAPGGRLYKTGDLARYMPDGNIQFLGRNDDQVKIHGFRIEPGEIEVILGKYAGVREVAVTAREDAPGDKRLVAYVVTSPDGAANATELRRFLQQRLPDYMIPSAFVFLDRMPLAPGGKVDRRALPAPDYSHDEREGNYAAPRTPVEEALARIWMNVLGVERISVDGNFFEMGGHSLLAVQLISRVNQEFGAKVPLRSIFDAPTIAQFAAKLRLLNGNAAGSPARLH
jgi:amino acid adenylation domain-containing protein